MSNAHDPIYSLRDRVYRKIAGARANHAVIAAHLKFLALVEAAERRAGTYVPLAPTTVRRAATPPPTSRGLLERVWDRLVGRPPRTSSRDRTALPAPVEAAPRQPTSEGDVDAIVKARLAVADVLENAPTKPEIEPPSPTVTAPAPAAPPRPEPTAAPPNGGPSGRWGANGS